MCVPAWQALLAGAQAACRSAACGAADDRGAGAPLGALGAPTPQQAGGGGGGARGMRDSLLAELGALLRGPAGKTLLGAVEGASGEQRDNLQAAPASPTPPCPAPEPPSSCRQ